MQHDKPKDLRSFAISDSGVLGPTSCLHDDTRDESSETDKVYTPFEHRRGVGILMMHMIVHVSECTFAPTTIHPVLVKP